MERPSRYEYGATISCFPRRLLRWRSILSLTVFTINTISTTLLNLLTGWVKKGKVGNECEGSSKIKYHPQGRGSVSNRLNIVAVQYMITCDAARRWKGMISHYCNARQRPSA